MPLSGSSNYNTTRDSIINRALRITGAIAQGESPTAAAVTEAAQTLNEIFKEWQADGLQLWRTETVALGGTIIPGATISINVNPPAADVNYFAPLKVLRVWYRDADDNDMPINLITKDEYDRLTPKFTQGIPNQCYYQTPGAFEDGNSPQGVFYFYPAMSQEFIDDNDVYVTAVFPLQDFDSSTDEPDIPNYLINALVWALADQLCYEYGVGLAERSMIQKKAMTHKAIALSFDQEEGSLFIRPTYSGEWEKTI
jgi:hypothetical protein